MGFKNLTSGLPIKRATNRVTAANLSRLAQSVGRCGDIDPLSGNVCVTQPHDMDVQHMAVQIGGPADGRVYGTWGGSKQNLVMPQTQPVPEV